MSPRPTTPPQHGERRCYLRGCRRPECVDANKRYCKKYSAVAIRGPIRLSAEPLARHLDMLSEQGFSHTQMASAAGPGRHTGEISKLRLRQQTTVHPDVARAYFRINLAGVRPALATVDATGTIRRGQALCVIGHPVYQIASAIPMSKNILGVYLETGVATVKVPVAEGMAAAYHDMSRRPGNSLKIRRAAARNGWHGPLAWDGNAIDDPEAQPESDVDEVALKRDELGAIRRAEIGHLDRFGLSEHEIARRLGMNTAYVRDIVRELHGMPARDRIKAAA